MPTMLTNRAAAPESYPHGFRHPQGGATIGDMPSYSAGDAGRFLTLSDTAEILNVEVAEVTELVESGELPAIQLGGHWRVDRELLESFITGLYEQQRRRALWQQSDFASLAELSGGTILRPGE